MNKYSFLKRPLNLLIFLILIAQIIIIYINSKETFEEIQKKNISIENFSSIALGKYGITSFGSEKLNKLDDDNIFLEGNSYLENKVYKIYGEDITINIKSEVSYSDRPVEVINSSGKMNSNGFKNVGVEGKIYFLGESIFTFDE